MVNLNRKRKRWVPKVQAPTVGVCFTCGAISSHISVTGSGIKLVYICTISSMGPMVEEIYEEESVDSLIESNSSSELTPKKMLLDQVQDTSHSTPPSSQANDKEMACSSVMQSKTYHNRRPQCPVASSHQKARNKLISIHKRVTIRDGIGDDLLYNKFSTRRISSSRSKSAFSINGDWDRMRRVHGELLEKIIKL
ncbi:hypothetical protein Tco_1002516 [Tanacetum coccineum]|uniref:Uncharacterized protein n=1 Tax=Tanacetum coccineum TaxID=301880 RepID=A0ABQ5F7Y0_9ASTR